MNFSTLFVTLGSGKAACTRRYEKSAGIVEAFDWIDVNNSMYTRWRSFSIVLTIDLLRADRSFLS